MLFYPTPDQAYPVYIDSWSRLQNIAALNTPISLPPGYNRLIVNGLAIALARNGMERRPRWCARSTRRSGCSSS
jgi:hypothetical protein